MFYLLLQLFILVVQLVKFVTLCLLESFKLQLKLVSLGFQELIRFAELLNPALYLYALRFDVLIFGLQSRDFVLQSFTLMLLGLKILTLIKIFDA